MYIYLLFCITAALAKQFVYLQDKQFSVAVIPDTQEETGWWRDIVEEQTYWCCQCEQQLKIIFVSQLGDIVHNQENDHQWQAALNAFSLLSTCDLPYGVLPGNHDEVVTAGVTTYAQYDNFFTPQSLGADGNYPEGTAHNSYYLFTIGDRKGWVVNFIFLQLEYLPNANNVTAVMDWAGEVLTNYSTYTAIISTHYSISDCATSSSSAYGPLATLVKAHCNVIMVWSGHAFFCGGQNAIAINTTQCGLQWLLVSDYQDRTDGGGGWLRVYNFTYTDSTHYSVVANTYSPAEEATGTDAESFFTLSFPGGAQSAGEPGFLPCTSTFARPAYLMSTMGGMIGGFVLFLIITQ